MVRLISNPGGIGAGEGGGGEALTPFCNSGPPSAAARTIDAPHSLTSTVALYGRLGEFG